MKKIILIVFISQLTILVSAQSWTLIWEDDFSSNSLDETKWVHELGSGSQYNLWGWGNGELQFYQPENTTFNNGIATITVKQEPNGLVNSWGNSYYYSSSRITTKGLFSFRYGKVEARIKSIDGQGFWPAFWLLPFDGNWPCDGEIDIMEHWGNNYLTNNTSGAAHIGTCPYSQSSHFYQNFDSYISSGSYADDFHTYSVIWKEDTIKWFVDDVEQFTLTPSSFFSIPDQHQWPFNSNQWYIILNLAITQSGPSASTAFPNNIEIDYVRVFQENVSSVPSNTQAEMIIYPNPTNSILNIQGHRLDQLSIFDLEGRLILENNLLPTQTTIDLSTLQKGLYFLKVENALGQVINRKLILN